MGTFLSKGFLARISVFMMDWLFGRFLEIASAVMRGGAHGNWVERWHHQVQEQGRTDHFRPTEKIHVPFEWLT